jgi:hypothetical protein
MASRVALSRLQGSLDPSAALDYASKQYVDTRLVAIYTGVVPSGSTSAVVTHNLNTTSIMVTVRDATTGDEVIVPNAATSANTATLLFTTAPTSGQYNVRIEGGLSAGGYQPPPVTLTDAATIATNASLGNYFRVTLGGNRTLGNPTNPFDGQKIMWELIQDATGSRTITLGSAFALGTDISAVTLTTTASKTDFLGAIYNSTAAKWRVVSFVKGY